MSPDVTCSAIVVGAGNGTRFGAPDKVLVELGGLPLIEYSLRIFSRIPAITEVVLVLSPETLDAGRRVASRFQKSTSITICLGGETRSDSVRAGLEQTSSSVDLVAVHDGARPLLTRELVVRLLEAAIKTGAAAPAMQISDTVLGVDEEGRAGSPVDRSQLRTIQTPQIARRDWLLNALLHRNLTSTDESSTLHQAGYPVTLVDGDPENIKITWPRDLRIAEAILRARAACV